MPETCNRPAVLNPSTAMYTDSSLLLNFKFNILNLVPQV
eukprot:SAG31_NODE_24242_length_486_cov_0.739018_1_plen_38_part_10